MFEGLSAHRACLVRVGRRDAMRVGSGRIFRRVCGHGLFSRVRGQPLWKMRSRLVSTRKGMVYLQEIEYTFDIQAGYTEVWSTDCGEAGWSFPHLGRGPDKDG